MDKLLWYVIFIILIGFGLVQLLTNKLLSKHLQNITQSIVNAEISDIEENSQIDVNKQLGGIDTINADNTITGIEEQTPLVFQTNTLGQPRLPVSESFNATPLPILQLFYDISCGHSQAFLPIWYEIVAALPANLVRYEEINCGDVNCKEKMNINSIPLLRLLIINDDGSINKRIVYNSGDMSYNDIKYWLSTHNISLISKLKVNLSEGYTHNKDMTTDKEGFMGDAHIGLDIVNTVIEATGNIRQKWDESELDAAALDKHGHHYDIEDGCYKATFSKCHENSQNPGYQIFTHRGQWGCVKPEAGTGISTPFDAAFAVANEYLSNVPRKHNMETGEPIEWSSEEEHEEQVGKCAAKYRKEMANFGLCDVNKLNEKYEIPNKIKQGLLTVPVNNMNADDYKDAARSAAALFKACQV